MRRIAAVLLAVGAASAAHAQGTVGGQGFGYPAGQHGARSAGTAGALAPFDAVSAVNPAAVALWRQSVVYFHLEPELRSTSLAGSRASTRVSRFPLSGGATRIRSNGSLAVTFSTYLDRTWETEAITSSEVGSDVVDVSTRYSSIGSINDLRVATGWQLGSSLRVGAAYHAYTGNNRLEIRWDFPDTLPFGDVSQSSVLVYTGRGVSGGAEWAIPKFGAVAAYARLGGRARLRVSDTLVAEASMPSHSGLAVRYDGIAGTTIAAGWERIGWASLADLGTATLGVRDSDKWTIGAEARGPSIGASPMFLRAGLGRRGLPFDALGKRVSETAITFGAGVAVARGRGNVDLGLQRLSRSAQGSGASERAWMFTFGLAITP